MYDSSCHPLFITGCIRTYPSCLSSHMRKKLPSPIHHGLHSDIIRKTLTEGPDGSCHPLFITGCIRTGQEGKQIVIDLGCHPLFITGCIRTNEFWRRWRPFRCCHPLFITGCIRTVLAGLFRGKLPVAIPYSSRVAFGHRINAMTKELQLGLPSPIHHGLHSDRISKKEVHWPARKLPSPIHHGLHSDRFTTSAMDTRTWVAIPYSSRVAFGPSSNPRKRTKKNCCHPLFITGCIRTSRPIFYFFFYSKLPSPIHHGLHSDRSINLYNACC